MRVLILGVSGFIGNNLYSLLEKDHQVYGVSRTKVELKNCTALNLLNADDTRKYFSSHNFDAIINLASKMASVENARDMELFTDNVQMQINLINALRDYKDCIFINFSSSAVYPNINGKFNEESIIDPAVNGDSLYGLAKFNSEILFRSLFPGSVKVINLRIGYVYGKGMNSTRIHKVFENELEEKNTITVFSNGERVIPQIHVDKLVQIVHLFVKYPLEGTYNIANENITLFDLAGSIIKDTGNNASEIVKVAKGKNTRFKLDVTKLNLFLKKHK